MLSSANFEKSDDGYGLYTYTAIVENTSDISFENVYLNVALYDADGVRAEECYADTSAWAPGEKVKFEVMSEVDASRLAPTGVGVTASRNSSRELKRKRGRFL